MGRFRHSSRLLPLLLAVAATELLLNRIAVDVLRPPPGAAITEPPIWHQALDIGALFVYYFASALAVGVMALEALHLIRKGDRPYPRELSIIVGAFASVFVVLAAWTVIVSPGATLSLAFDAIFAALFTFICVAQLKNRGDARARLGIVLFSVPLAIHFSGVVAIWIYANQSGTIGIPEAVGVLGMPEAFHRMGQLSMAAAAITAPLFFGPQPLLRNAVRIGPAAVASLVGLTGAVVLRERYDVGMDLASRGLGIHLGPGAPTPMIAVYLIGLATLTWTLVSCLVATSPGRRQIGIGLGLVVVGGYAFAWPLHYLAAIIGLLAIGDGARGALAEETDTAPREAFSAPPVGDDAWQAYVAELASKLEGTAPVTSRDDGSATTHVVGKRRDTEVRLRILREKGRVRFVDILCGAPPPESATPGWTLLARPEKLLAGTHPEPPAIPGATVARSGDPQFDRRFRVRERDGAGDAVLDADLRARATALIDGWLAFWPPESIILRIHPGCGAPLDHPIPISELAFRGESATPSADRLIAVIDLLVDIHASYRSSADSAAARTSS